MLPINLQGRGKRVPADLIKEEKVSAILKPATEQPSYTNYQIK
jgi:hypothetical protein